jgi:hypothetical protein
MDKIGFEDCDYISHEQDWTFWKHFQKWDVPMELHVPCRDPIEHLMSECNYRNKKIACSQDLASQVWKCLGKHLELRKRFSPILKNLSNVYFKGYITYMDQQLQRKRVLNDYVHRATNKPRNKTTECIWAHDMDSKRSDLNSYLVANVDYYSYCNHCLGSKDDLLA